METKHIDRIMTLRSWAKGRDSQNHKRIDKVGIDIDHPIFKEKIPQRDKSINTKDCSKSAFRLAKRASKCRQPEIREKLMDAASQLREFDNKPMHPAKARKLAREQRRAELR